MKKILNQIIIICITVLAFYSCSDKEGEWDDVIILSEKNIEFGSEADSAIITTQGDWWWITGITVNNKTYRNSYYEDPELYNYCIEYNCVVVEKRDKHTLFIKVEDNMLAVNRYITIELEAGDYFDRISITQKGS